MTIPARGRLSARQPRRWGAKTRITLRTCMFGLRPRALAAAPGASKELLLLSALGLVWA
jgi:hypothetical protein